MAEKDTATVTPTRQENRQGNQQRNQSESRLARRMPWSVASPLGMFQRFADEMDRVFDDFGFGRQGLTAPSDRAAVDVWAPKIDVFQRGHELVIKADLPGMNKEDIKVDITDDAVTLQGERRREHEEEREGMYRIERSYGSFSRIIPLPEGAITEQAKAACRNGVLEITMPVPPEQVTRGRRLEINENAEKK